MRWRQGSVKQCLRSERRGFWCLLRREAAFEEFELNRCTMSVLLETSKGDLVVDLFTEEAPRASMNFLKLCK